MNTAELTTFFKSRRGLLVLWAFGTLLAAAITLFMVLRGIPGWDDAAHCYKVFLLRGGNSIFWDNFWYGGSYGAVAYGFLFYLVASVVPAKVIVVFSAGVIPVAFFLYQRCMWGIDAVLPAWALAAVMGVYLAHGQDPFIFALALTLGGLAVHASGRPILGAVLVGFAIFSNPMAFVACFAFMVTDVVVGQEVRRRYLVFFCVVALFVALRVGIGWAFHESGAYLNETTQLLLYLGFALVGIAVAGVNVEHSRRRFVTLFAVYGVLCIASFITPGSPIGNNIGRFFFVFALPLFTLLRRTRMSNSFFGVSFVLLCVFCFTIIQVSVPYSHFTRREELTQTERSFFEPALSVAAERHDVEHRIHVVALCRHWEAVFFPEAGYPITRGWYRQADAIHNSILATSYSEQQYVAWLRRMGVEYIYVPHTPLDLWGEREASLLARSSAFEAIAQPGSWTVYRLRHAEPLAVGLGGGRARLLALEHQSLRVRVDRPGRYLLKVTWSPYWRVERGEGHLSSTPDRLVLLSADRAGDYDVHLRVTAAAVVAQIRGRLLHPLGD